MSEPDADIDLLCCAVSVLSQNAVMGLTDIAEIQDGMFAMDDGLLSYELPSGLPDEQMQTAQILLRSMMLGLESLANGAPTFIKILEDEELSTKE